MTATDRSHSCPIWAQHLGLQEYQSLFIDNGKVARVSIREDEREFIVCHKEMQWYG